MGILLTKSTNPDFSYVLFKNPNSGMICKNLRKGTSFGWYGKEDTYLVYFKDSHNDVSYSKNDKIDFEYNDLTRYNSPVFVLNVLNDYFSSTFKKLHELDTVGFENSVVLNLEVQRINLIKNMFYRTEGIDISYENLGGNNYNITIKTKDTLNKLFNFLNVYCLFIGIIDDYWINMNEEMLKKYVKSLNEINANYYMRYLFQLKVIVSKKLFNTVKDELENLCDMKLELNFGSTADWRRDFVFDNLNLENDILDVGCGEGFYSLPLAKKLPNNIVNSIDIDENCIRFVNSKALSRGFNNLVTYNDLSEYLNVNGIDNKVDIILVEVIEHMEKEDSKILIKELLKLNFGKFFITSPVQEFNVHYDLNNSFDEKEKNGFRHPDHKWEGTVNEFTSLVLECIKEVLNPRDLVYSYKHVMIGDLVDGIAPTQGIILEITN